MQTKPTGVALVDDHVLLRKGLANFINEFSDYRVLFEANDGQMFIDRLDPKDPPDIVLLDIGMPIMDGYDTALWIRENLPLAKVLALSMFDNDVAVIRMLKNGARGYILKDIEPAEMKTALDSVSNRGYYYSEIVSGTLLYSITGTTTHGSGDTTAFTALNEKEVRFLKLCCSELTYKEIADQMCVSPRTIDGYRDALFQKLHVKTRVGLVIYAIKNCLFTV